MSPDIHRYFSTKARKDLKASPQISTAFMHHAVRPELMNKDKIAAVRIPLKKPKLRSS